MEITKYDDNTKYVYVGFMFRPYHQISLPNITIYLGSNKFSSISLFNFSYITINLIIDLGSGSHNTKTMVVLTAVVIITRYPD